MDSKYKRILRRIASSKKSLILSFVALVEVLAIMTVATYSWVESVSSIKIYTSAFDEANGTKGIINNPLKQRASIDKNSADVIDLTNYFRPSGDFHFAPCSSADGVNFYFPEVEKDHTQQLQNIKYRLGTISDKNVNYLSFTFKVMSACNLAFLNEPTIKLGDTVVNSSLVRVSIGLNGEFNIYSKTAAQDDVVKSEDGTEGTTNVSQFSDYVSGANKLITTAGGDYVTINMWIQDQDYSHYSEYANKKLTVTNFKLVPVDKFTVKALSNEQVSGEGGSVAVGNGVYGAEAVAYAAVGSDIILHASPNPAAGYGFVGWKMDTQTTTTPISTNNPYTYTVQSGVNTIYAYFSDEHVLYLRTGYHHKGNPRYAAYIWSAATGSSNTATWYSMTQESTDLYKCSYKGTATSVIFCYMNPANNTNQWSNKWLQTFDLNFPEEVGVYTYNVTSRYTESADGTSISSAKDDDSSVFTNDKLLGYWEHSYATVEAEYADGSTSAQGSFTAKMKNSTTSNSTVTWHTNTSGSHVFVKLDGTPYETHDNQGTVLDSYDRTVQLKASNATGYSFVGWFDEEDTLLDSSATYDVHAPANGLTDTYYAKFKEATLYTTDTDASYSGNTIVLINHSAVGDDNYKYINMYQSGTSWGTGIKSMTNTNYGKNYRNLWFYKLTPNIDNNNNIVVQLAKDQNYTDAKYMENGTQKGWQKVVKGYKSGTNDMTNETYDALKISNVYYPTRLVRGETAVIKARATYGCPYYVSQNTLSGSSTTQYEWYTMTYTIKDSGGTEVYSDTATREQYDSDVTGADLEVSCATSASLATGSYTLTVTLSDGIDSVSRTETINVID